MDFQGLCKQVENQIVVDITDLELRNEVIEMTAEQIKEKVKNYVSDEKAETVIEKIIEIRASLYVQYNEGSGDTTDVTYQQGLLKAYLSDKGDISDIYINNNLVSVTYKLKLPIPKMGFVP